MKQCKLVVHQKSFNAESLIINSKDFNNIKIGDILEIHLPEDEYSRLLLQVTSLQDELQQKDTISIEQSIAQCFQLRAFAEVIVNKVEVKDVSLDSVELSFKDQYLARSDMWRLKNSMCNSCVYLNKKIDFYGIRSQVFEMWAQGERVACGVVTEDTKVVYRSASSMVYLFLQMSAEMWDFDINGDLYFEKAINGFLSDLFAKWKKFNCNHDVTIVLFSRTFYEAIKIEEFPSYMRECLKKDYKGRFYEDFYRVAVQNERYDDWSSVLFLLKKLFNEYQSLVLEHHSKPGIKIPRAVNSTSSQGNFLEVLNMSLNVFEKHYMDRSFDRTGQLSVVISPGVGVFEVDIKLTNITKQRIIDNGIGSDLVCLGEQPLHAVPLFKFHDKQSASFNDVDGYNMPHWINLSFYSSAKHLTSSNFVPRIKLPTPLSKAERLKVMNKTKRSRHISQPEHSFPSVFDYDEYDANVFKLPVHSQGKGLTNSLQRSENRRKLTAPCGPTVGSKVHVSTHNIRSRKASEDVGVSFHIRSDPLPSSSSSSCGAVDVYFPVRSSAISIPQKQSQRSTFLRTSNVEEYEESHHSYQSYQNWNNERPTMRRIDDSELTPTRTPRPVIGSAPSPAQHPTIKQIVSRKPRALVNPFDPSHVTIKLTSNRRRWTHVFPLGPTGIFMQQHHYQAIPQNKRPIASATINRETNEILIPSSIITTTPRSAQQTQPDVQQHDSHPVVVSRFHVEEVVEDKKVHPKSSLTHASSSSIPLTDPFSDRNQSWLWGATGEQEWTPAITTGVDWKSLVIPACLPITTDYFPDKRNLQTSFGISVYTLLPEDISIDLTQLRCYRDEEDHRHHLPLTTPQVFQELICQRLQQSFQIIILSKQHPSYPHTQIPCNTQISQTIPGGNVIQEYREEYLMSIGHIFHKLTLDGSCITVTQYRPRHTFPTIDINYCYRFRAPDNDTYGISWVDFTNEKLETFNWNYLDHYICQRGLGEYELKDNMKFWRLRMLLLPGTQNETKKIIEGDNNCDIYQPISEESKHQQQDGFLKFLEILNKIIYRRPTNLRKAKALNKNQQTQMRRFSVGQTTFSVPQAFGSGLRTNNNPLFLNSGAGPDVNFYRDRVNSTGTRMRVTSSKVMDRVRSEIGSLAGRISPASEADNKLSGSSTSLEGAQDGENDDIVLTEIKKLGTNSSNSDLIEAMKHTTNGLSFLVKQPGLPAMTFISGEAVSYVKDHVEGVHSDEKAIQILQSCQDDQLILHASGEQHPFINGFYLYHLPVQDHLKGVLDSNSDEPDLEMFQNEWIEVEIPPVKVEEHFSSHSDFYSNNLQSWEDDLEKEHCRILANDIKNKLSFKKSNIEINSSSKLTNDRVEWGKAKYHSHFQPGTAYEIVLEWMVATGNTIAELVLSWARKAGSMSLHLVPIPSDPFALPFSSKSDPLRGPIFIPLLIELLPVASTEDLQDENLSAFQDKILQKFGFLPHWDNSALINQQQYVHTSGSIFVITLPCKQQEVNGLPINKNQNMSIDEICSPHEEYITRHFSDIRKNELSLMNSNPETKVGFLLSWNYMITKRWKSSATGDEHFMRKILHNLKSFCENQNERLEEFWNAQLLEGILNPDSESILQSELVNI